MTRGRKPNLEGSIATNLHLPASARTRLDLLLFSEVEGRVPKGAYQRFFLERLHEFFNLRTADLSDALNQPPGTHTIRAKPDTILAITAVLRSKA